MSSTVGYGFEIPEEVLDEHNGSSGDFQYDIENNYPDLQVVISQAEYGDESRTFVFIRNSVVEAGVTSTAVRLKNGPTEVAALVPFLNTVNHDLGEPDWYLVDYYVYS